MGEPWDRPPFPKRGNASDRALFESIGRALDAWENVETSLAHLFAVFSGVSRFDRSANDRYGIPLNFTHRLGALQKVAARYFTAHPHQTHEAEFDDIVRLAGGYSLRRNDIAHGLVRFIQLVYDPHATLLGMANTQCCLVPPHFRADKITARNVPVYVYTSREINRFALAFWDIARDGWRLSTAVQRRASP